MSVMTAAAPRRLGAVLWGTRGLRELLLLGSLYVAYSATRVFAADDLTAARGRARHIEAIEASLHLDVESWLNRGTTSIGWLAVPMDYWYCALHYLVTPVVIGWLYVRRRNSYATARNAIVIASALGLVGYLTLPTAPPRLMGGSYVDTLARYANFGWWSGHASAPAGLGGLTNELAAMPSLHVGWAVWVAWAIWRNSDSRARLLVPLYPLGTALVVVCTGNHWVLDAIVGLLVTTAGICVAGAIDRRRTTPTGRDLR